MATFLRIALVVLVGTAVAASASATELAFPAPGLFEREPDLVPGYVDSFNGDWDHVQSIVVPNSMPVAWDLPARFCESGWGFDFADEDWFWLGDYPSFEAVTFLTESPIEVDEIREIAGEPVVVQTVTVLPDEGLDLVLTASWNPVYLRVAAVPQGPAPLPDEVTVFHYCLHDRDRPPAYELVLDETNDDCAFLEVVPAVYWGMENSSLGNFWFEGDTGSGLYTDRYDPGVAGGLPEVADGPDAVIELFLIFESLTVWLEAADWPAVCYLLTDCSDPEGSCVAVSGPEGTLTFEPPPGFDGGGYYYLVVDGLQGASGPFTLAGEFSYGQIFGYGEDVLPLNNDCDGALSLGPGPFQVTQAMNWAHNDHDPGVQGCTGRGDTGQDVVYRVEMQIGDVLDVTMTTDTGWDDSIYLVTDCGDPVDSCVAGADTDPDGSHFAYAATDAGTYYLIADSHGFRPGEFTLTGSVTPSVAVGDPPRSGLALACYPNPFNPRTRLNFTVPAAGPCRLSIHALDGRNLRTLVDGFLGAGPHEVAWDGRDDRGRTVAAGAYVAHLITPVGMRSRKLVMIR